MLRFGASIFLSAFLLFAVQPLLGKALLPWFGGSPAVWTTCLVFFQVLLLAGYAWAHLLQRFDLRRQAWLHGAVLLAAGGALIWAAVAWRAPLLPNASWRPTDSAAPTWRTLRILLVGAGAPTLLLAATSPLLQRWFSHLEPGRSPFRLYALSNAGSLSALLGYPFLVEPLLPLRAQAWAWAVVFGLLGAGLVACALPLLRSAPSAAEAPPVAEAPAPRLSAGALWVLLSALPSLTLLAVTNHLCQEIAPVPFLWVLPLALYLLTFILCFDSDRWYSRVRFVPALAVLLVAGGALLVVRVPVIAQVGVFSALLFAVGMVCHGELALRRPAPAHLTRFYLSIAAGGALGGVCVALLAPVFFDTFLELDLALALAGLVTVALLRSRSWLTGGAATLARVGVNVLLFVLGGLLVAHGVATRAGSLASARSFFGTVRVVKDRHGPAGASRVALMHGATLHGFQVASDAWRARPTAYFTERSGIGRTLTNHPRRRAGEPLKLGVVGLGIGTLAAYTRAGDALRVYELSPDVARLAQDRALFTYLADASGEVTVVLGDGRLALERELAERGPHGFDVLVIDAFGSDSVPVHLLTREAFAAWSAHLRGADSVLAFNVLNRTLDLAPLVLRLADDAGLASAHVVTSPARGEEDPVELRAEWVLLARSPAVLASLGLEPDLAPRPSSLPRAWTDDFSNLAELLKSPLSAR